MIGLTKAERLAVAKKARSMLRKGWTKGTWEEDVTTPSGNAKRCLEGHCNAAAVEVLGEEKAIQLGAARRSPFTGNVIIATNGVFTKRLSVATMARNKLHAMGDFRATLAYAGQRFNDLKTTKKADVVALLDEYIAEMESK